MNPDELNDLSPEQSAIIVAGMRHVAMADGAIHERELELIEALGSDLPQADPLTPLSSQAARDAYLQSLAMVALADGILSSVETTAIRQIAAAQGFSGEQVDAVLVAVKHQFFRVFAGVKHFREQAVGIGRELGLAEHEIEQILNE